MHARLCSQLAEFFIESANRGVVEPLATHLAISSDGCLAAVQRWTGQALRSTNRKRVELEETLRDEETQTPAPDLAASAGGWSQGLLTTRATARTNVLALIFAAKTLQVVRASAVRARSFHRETSSRISLRSVGSSSPCDSPVTPTTTTAGRSPPSRLFSAPRGARPQLATTSSSLGAASASAPPSVLGRHTHTHIRAPHEHEPTNSSAGASTVAVTTTAAATDALPGCSAAASRCGPLPEAKAATLGTADVAKPKPADAAKPKPADVAKPKPTTAFADASKGMTSPTGNVGALNEEAAAVGTRPTLESSELVSACSDPHTRQHSLNGARPSLSVRGLSLKSELLASGIESSAPLLNADTATSPTQAARQRSAWAVSLLQGYFMAVVLFALVLLLGLAIGVLAHRYTVVDALFWTIGCMTTAGSQMEADSSLLKVLYIIYMPLAAVSMLSIARTLLQTSLRRAIRRDNYRLRLHELVLDEAKARADPELTMSEADFVLRVLKARSLIDDKTLDAIRTQYAAIVRHQRAPGSHIDGLIDARVVFHHLIQQDSIRAPDVDLYGRDEGFQSWFDNHWRPSVLEEQEARRVSTASLPLPSPQDLPPARVANSHGYTRLQEGIERTESSQQQPSGRPLDEASLASLEA